MGENKHKIMTFVENMYQPYPTPGIEVSLSKIAKMKICQDYFYVVGAVCHLLMRTVHDIHHAYLSHNCG